MKNKRVIVIVIISVVLIIAGLVTSYIDSARVRNSMEPKFAIKIITDGGNKVTYWGLGYKVIRYTGVSPYEPFKNSLGVKYGSWLMKYELSAYENIDIEVLMDDKTIQVSKKSDAEFIINLLKDSKYINEICLGLTTHKIKLGDEVYYLKEGCSAIQRGDKQAEVSEEDLEKFLEIVEGCSEINLDINEDGQYQFIGIIIEAYESSIIVEPEEGSNERKSSDKISMKITRPTSGVNDFFVVGNKVKISYNGMIMESYPAKIVAEGIELTE